MQRGMAGPDVDTPEPVTTPARDPELSLVIPCFREESHLAANLDELVATMAMTDITYEIILVDDCSPDRTRDVMRAAAERHAPRVRCAFHERNTGRGGAVKTGLGLARGRIAGFLDIDLEVHCRYIPSMVRLVRDGADIACAYRIYTVPLTFDDIFRDLLSVGYRYLIRLLLRIGVSDTVAPLVAVTQSDGWFWDTEIMALGAYRGFRIRELPVVYIRNADKETTVRPLRDAVESFKCLWAFRARTRPGLIYRHGGLYHRAMARLYRGAYRERFEAIAREVPEGAQVLDVCCGDAHLFDAYLRHKTTSYTGLDIAPALVARARSRGMDVRVCDIELMDLPAQADTVILQGSLYQFMPGHDAVLRKLLAAARDRVILTEAVSNWSGGHSALKNRLARALTNPGTGPKTERFTPESLDAFMKTCKVLKKESICGGREMLYVLDARREP